MASNAPAPAEQSAIGEALVNFSVNGLFPDEDVSAFPLSPEKLPGAIQTLAEAKSKLENDIHAIVDDTAEDVNTWVENAKALQSDFSRRKTVANDILKLSDGPDVSGKSIKEAEEKADFLVRELNYNEQVQQALRAIRGINQLLDEVERAADERRILDALHLLEKSSAELDALPISKSCRVMKLLDIRVSELKSNVHEVFDRVWNALVHVDVQGGKLSVLESREDEPMSLTDAVIGLRVYKEADQRMLQLWHELHTAIVGPRMDMGRDVQPGVAVGETTIETRGDADAGLKALLGDLQQIFSFLARQLPSELVRSISSVMMPEIVSRIVDGWLDAAVPSSLREMDVFQDTIAAAKQFCTALSELKYTGFGSLQEWVESAPRVWLKKRRETALDTVRTKLAHGLGAPQQVERVEKQMVSRSEGRALTAAAANPAADQPDWDAAWSDQEEKAQPGQQPAESSEPPEAEDDGADAWGAWGDEESEEPPAEDMPAEEEEKAAAATEEEGGEEDDVAAAWGWGDEDNSSTRDEADEALKGSIQASAKSGSESATREMVLKETYNISSMPEPVLGLISAILEDGAILTSAGYESSPVAAAAAGLFSLPTLALAMFRAISPYYYALDMGGNMFLYNDATYLAERLADLAASWKTREDLSTRARHMLRLDNEIKSLQSFATRSYSNEMSVQKTVLRDLLGGDQNVIQQDDSESFIDAAVARVRSMAAAWEGILARSAWYQAVGSLVDAVAAKVIADVMDMPSIGQEEAFRTANLIARVTALDDLFLPSRQQQGEGGDADADEPIPTTAQYAASWLRLKYLSEVLQSNLREVRYLWMESELSLYFSADEVVDLVNLSFEDNAKSREVIREITQHPHPVRG